jgi:hypothetical protein
MINSFFGGKMVVLRRMQMIQSRMASFVFAAKAGTQSALDTGLRRRDGVF